jgi:hypothetical protein
VARNSRLGNPLGKLPRMPALRGRSQARPTRQTRHSQRTGRPSISAAHLPQMAISRTAIPDWRIVNLSRCRMAINTTAPHAGKIEASSKQGSPADYRRRAVAKRRESAGGSRTTRRHARKNNPLHFRLLGRYFPSKGKGLRRDCE